MEKVKEKCAVPKSREEAETLLSELAIESHRLECNANALDKVLTNARAGFQSKIEESQKKIEEQQAALEAWAKANPDQFAEKKSLKLLHGTIGFRLSSPLLVLRSKMTWEKVRDRLKKAYQHYIRIKEEPDKRQILADATNGTLHKDDLAEIGVMLDQSENFFVDLKEL